MPRIDGSYRTWHTILIPAVYDYAALGRAADRVRVMAYDEHNCFTGRGPVSSLPWVRQVVAYTLENIPASKVEARRPLVRVPVVRRTLPDRRRRQQHLRPVRLGVRRGDRRVRLVRQRDRHGRPREDRPREPPRRRRHLGAEHDGHGRLAGSDRSLTRARRQRDDGLAVAAASPSSRSTTPRSRASFRDRRCGLVCAGSAANRRVLALTSERFGRSRRCSSLDQTWCLDFVADESGLTARRVGVLLSQLVTEEPMIALRGPRSVGKSTVLQILTAGLRQLCDGLGPRFSAGVVLTAGQRTYTHDDRIHVMPIDRLWQADDLGPSVGWS